MKNNFNQLYAFGKKLPIDMSLSENPLGCSPRVINALKKLTFNFNDYPDPHLTNFKQQLADNFSVKSENILVGNGSESLIALIGQTLITNSQNVIIPELTFPLLEVVAQLNNIQVKLAKMDRNLSINLKNIAKLQNRNTKLIFLCNPNNPTGNTLPKNKIIQLVKNTHSLVVVDEANIEFGGKSVMNLINQLPNLIILRTFSKAFGLASLRIGVLIASAKVVKLLETNRPPFPVSSLSIELCSIALSDQQFIQKTKCFIFKERAFLVKELKQRNFKVFPTQANNIFVQSPKAFKRKNLVNQLITKGVSVVAGSNFNNLSDDFMRICPRTRKINQLFLKKIDEILVEN